MDISSILPLLMGRTGREDNQLASVLSAMNSGTGAHATDNNRLAPLLSMMNGGSNSNGGGINPAMLMPLLNKNAQGSNNGMDIVNLVSALGANKKAAPPKGLQPIKSIVPNDILGVLVKMIGQ